MANLQQLESALIRADAAGDMDAARKLAAVIRRERSARESDQQGALLDQIGGGDADPQVSETIPQAAEPTLGEQVIGAGEAGLTVATGMTGGMAGTLAGSVEGILKEAMSGQFGTQEAAKRIEELAMERAGQFTYEPRTPAGQSAVEGVAEAMAPLAAIPPLAEAQIIAQSASQLPARAMASQAARPITDAIERARQPRSPESSPYSDRSVGAAGVDEGLVRQSMADELPVPIRLTEGQRTREFEAQRFERETAKTPEGAPIRDRFEEQNLQLQQNMDEFIDMTGSEITDLRGVGEVVDRALRSRAASDKMRIRALYKDAERAGELDAHVDINPLAKYLNENRAERVENGIMGKVQRQIDALEVGQGSFAEGSLQLRPMSLKEAEAVRRFINRNVNDADPNDIRIGAALKRAIDDSTEGAGGGKYQQARRARAKYAKDYENVGLVKNIIGLKKGSDDRAIALEDVLRKTILDPGSSLDSVRHVRRLLQTGGPEGKQAWAELQGNTLRHIQNQMTKGVTTNQRGDRVVSASALHKEIEKLDKNGKLDFVFGKKGAEQLRTIDDVAQVVLTAPPGSVNYSNTATVLAGLMDVAMTGVTGVPAPIASGFKLLTDRIKDNKLKARIKRTLGE